CTVSSQSLICTHRGATRRTLSIQNDASEFMDLCMPRKCSASYRIIDAKYHARSTASLKPTLSAGPFTAWVSQMIPFSDWPRLTASSQRTSDWRGSQMWSICPK
uniref:Uncharacterized protein n=1 Tax=Balaenoptera musculus TaxID=9771 RepID=A0A8C0CGE9_BALMU